MRKHSRRTSGFTLVELLVVIGIIAVLMSIALPVMGKVRASARSVACQSNLRQVGVALLTYSGDNKGLLPYAGSYARTPRGGVSNMPARRAASLSAAPLLGDWAGALASDLNIASDKGTATVRVTTRVGNRNVTTNQTVTTLMGAPITTCGDAIADPARKFPTSYAIHPLLSPIVGDLDRSVSPARTMAPYKLSRLNRTSEVIMVFESAQVVANGSSAMPTANRVDNGGILPPNGWFNPSARDNGNVVVSGRNRDDRVYYESTATGNLRFRHNGNRTGNFLFADNHIESLRPNQILRKNIRIDR